MPEQKCCKQAQHTATISNLTNLPDRMPVKFSNEISEGRFFSSSYKINGNSNFSPIYCAAHHVIFARQKRQRRRYRSIQFILVVVAFGKVQASPHLHRSVAIGI